MLSVVVLAKNEEGNIEECLKTLKWAEEIVVIDDNSEDETLEIVQRVKGEGGSKGGEGKEDEERRAEIKIFKRDLQGDFAVQRNFGLEKAIGDWILFVDADERVSPKLQAEIQSTIHHAPLTINGFYLKREDHLFGTILKHGETAGVRLLRLGKKGAGKWEGRVHETWRTMGKLGELEEPLEHYPHPTISEFLEKINDYSTLRARELFDQEISTNLFEIICYPIGKFFQNYLLRLGFLDKMPGFTIAVLMSFHSFLVRSKLYLLWKQERYPKSAN